MGQQGVNCQTRLRVTLWIIVGPTFNISRGFGLSLFWESLECSEGYNWDGRRVESATMSFY